MDTLQRTISIIEKEIAKNLTFVQKEIDTEHEQRHGSARTSMSIAFSKECQ